MSGIDKQRIEGYFKGKYSSEGEKYLSNAFVEESTIEEIKTILNEKWEEVLKEAPEKHNLDHIIHRINFLINSSTGKHKERPVMRFIIWYARIASILLIPILVYVGMVTFQTREPAPTQGWAEIRAPMGARIKFSLPDGSFGWLNSGSTIKYALNFTQVREVQLSGEAFFDVVNKDGRQFVVKTRGLEIEVRGTAFDVAAYADEDQIDVTLEHGSIILKNERFTVPVAMIPEEQVSYDLKKQTLTKSKVTALNFSAWKEGKLMLRNASIEDLAKQLSRWYNIKVIVQNPQHVDFRYRATFEDENLNEVLRLLKISSPLDFNIEERVKLADGSFSKQKVVLKVKK